MQNNNNNNNQPQQNGPDLPVHTEILLRGSDNNKAGLKEKFVAIYESFFKVLHLGEICSFYWQRNHSDEISIMRHYWKVLLSLFL